MIERTNNKIILNNKIIKKNNMKIYNLKNTTENLAILKEPHKAINLNEKRII